MAADSADLLVARATQELEAAGVESSRLEAQLLLALALGVSRTTILAGLAPEPDERQRAEFARLVRARARRVPLAYLRGTQEFYGLTFAVSPAVLIPRPETELLVEFALEKLGETHPPSPSPQGRGSKPDASALQPDLEETERLAHPLPSPLQGEGQGVRVEANRAQPAAPLPLPSPCSWGEGPGEGGQSGGLLDVGTGSGCIVIAALAHCATAQAVALDLSWEALTLARRNAETNGVSARVRFAQGDLLTGVKSAGFDVIVSNPPYIPTAEVPTLQSEVRDFEPRLALDGGADGLVLLRGLSSGAQRVLRPGGWLGVEVALGQAETVAALLHAAGWGAVETRRDLAGIARVVCGQKSGE